MGAWGHRPRDNDGAMDMLGLVEDAAGNAAWCLYFGGHATEESDFGDGQRWARLGVVECLVDASFSMPKALVREAKEDCEHFLKSSTYFKSFNEPQKARRATRKLLKRLEGMKAEAPFGILRAMSKGEGPKVPRKPKRKSTATKRKPRGKPAPKKVPRKLKGQKRTRSRGKPKTR